MSHPCNSQVKFQLLNVFIREKKSRLDKVASQKTEVGFNSPISCLSLVPMSQIQIPQCVSQSPSRWSCAQVTQCESEKKKSRQNPVHESSIKS